MPIEPNAPLPFPLTRSDLIHQYGFQETEGGFLEPPDHLLQQQPQQMQQLPEMPGQNQESRLKSGLGGAQSGGVVG